MKNPSSFIPKDHQAPYSLEQKILHELPSGGETLCLDVLFVGAGPAALAGAIRLAQLYQGQDIQIGVLEKASRLGGHSLSGAVINPAPFRKLFPNESEKDWPLRLPIRKEKMYFLTEKSQFRCPLIPTMKNKGFYTASLCEVVRWLGARAEKLGVNIFTSTSAQKLIVKQGQVIGIQTTAVGLDKDLNETLTYQPPVNIMAKTVFLCDGVRGNLSSTWLKWKNISSHYPPHYGLGVKEIWKVKKPLKEIIHTVGWPLDEFGGSFLYPLSKDRVALGLVGDLDSKKYDWNIHKKFQIMKAHPFFQKILKDGKCLEWGAKAIPKSGFHGIPQKISGSGVFILGDAAGLVNVPALKGIHYAMFSGILSAEYLFESQKNGRPKISFESLLKSHPLVGKDLYPVRNLVQALQESKILGLIKAGFMVLSSGKFPPDFNPKKLKADNFVRRRQGKKPKKKLLPNLGLSKTEAVYLSGNKTRDDIPSHLTLSSGPLPPEVREFYTHFCPAGVYEIKNGQMIVNSPNCIDCKATDILGPLWNPREGGAGPDYNLM